MDLVLQRTEFRADGIFSELRDAGGEHIAVTLEHSYHDGLGAFVPKLIDGRYSCVRGIHTLEGLGAFETFEITKVPGHTRILFHVGNFNSDSSGCVLLGLGISQLNSQQMITSSRIAFEKFLEFQEGIDQFMLIVKST